MKPPVFDYAAAATIEDAIALLAGREGGAKLIAGGQSLMPMLNFRLLEPELLVDISRTPGLGDIVETADGVQIGACVRHRDVLRSDAVARRFPVIRAAVAHVAHLAIRNRGTIGGSLAHADPAAEAPLLAALLDATLAIAGPDGRRQIGAQEFFLGPLSTDLAEDELLIHVTFPDLPPRAGWGFHEVARRSGDFALAGAGAIMDVRDGAIASARLALMGVGDTPLRVVEVETALAGDIWGDAARVTAINAVRDAVAPTDDLQASADFRRHLAGVVAARALDDAWMRANGIAP